MADRAPIVRPITHTQPLAPSRAGGGHGEGGWGLVSAGPQTFWRGAEFGILYEEELHFSQKKRPPPSPTVQYLCNTISRTPVD